MSSPRCLYSPTRPKQPPRTNRRFGFATLFVALLLTTGCGATADPITAATPTPTFPSELPVAIPGQDAKVYVIGDSWAWGVSAEPGEGYLRLLQRHYGWDILIDGQPGTGYEAVLANEGEPFIERVPLLPDEPPELVIIAGGLNDEWAGWLHISDEIEATLKAVEDRYPDTPIMTIGPVPTKIPVSEALTAVDLAIAQVGSDRSIPHVSPIQHGWVDEDNVAWFINEETKHPDSPGHAQLADWLITEFNARASR